METVVRIFIATAAAAVMLAAAADAASQQPVQQSDQVQHACLNRDF